MIRKQSLSNFKSAQTRTTRSLLIWAQSLGVIHENWHCTLNTACNIGAPVIHPLFIGPGYTPSWRRQKRRGGAPASEFRFIYMGRLGSGRVGNRQGGKQQRTREKRAPQANRKLQEGPCVIEASGMHRESNKEPGIKYPRWHSTATFYSL